MKIYSDPRPYLLQSNRYRLNDITKALWNDRTPQEREQVYGRWVKNFSYTPDIAEADIYLLAMKWPYYVERGLVGQAEAELSSARQHHKPFVIFSNSDYPAELPFEDLYLFESADYCPTSGLALTLMREFFALSALAECAK